jgi:hypothetical protein
VKAETEAAARFIDRELPKLEKLARAFLADARRCHELAVRAPGVRGATQRRHYSYGRTHRFPATGRTG